MPLDTKNILQSIKAMKEKTKKRNFVQSVELIINLQDIDPKKPEGKVQEVIELPHEVGKGNKICVIASGELALKAKRANADLVIERNELEAMTGNKKKQREIAKTYDSFIAEAPLMPLVGRVLGATLGPKGRMPTPVPPTVDIAGIIKKNRKTVKVRLRGQPVLQCRVGMEDMADKEIAENIHAVIGRVEGKLKRGIKNVRSINLKTAMGPSIKISL
ncbi:MAG: 50S ribosomal protein L1 [Candidatus Bathyarchaeota archaeon]|nr:50S ribosomal protein L1 [Candidatus Bathyarchaeota archaeon]MDH5732891.1 50S ribosomal protein L1 [Candidatus Bathyarchaeota archaeon]